MFGFSVSKLRCHAATIFAAIKAGYDTSTKILRLDGNLVPVGIVKQDIQISTFDLTMKKFYINAANNAAHPSELKACAEFTAKHGIASPSRYFRSEQINEMIEMMQGERMYGYRLVARFDDHQADGAIGECLFGVGGHKLLGLRLLVR